MRAWNLSLAGILAFSIITCFALAQVPNPQEQPPDGRQGPRVGLSGPFQGPPFDPMRMPLMTTLDTNHDGELSAEEIASAAEALKKLDKNNDGKLNREELRPQFGPGDANDRTQRRGPAGPNPRGMMGPFGPDRSASAENPPLAKDDAEKKILAALEEIPRKQGRMLNVPQADGRMLRVLAEAIGAKNVVEIGTSNGMSALWFCLALRTTGGKLITHEIDPETAALARENFNTASVADLVTLVEGDAHQTVSKLEGPIDLVFIDADKEGYSDYLKKTLPLVRPGGLIVAHNINPRMTNAEYLRAVTTNPDLETVFYLEGAGMSVTLKKR